MQRIPNMTMRFGTHLTTRHEIQVDVIGTVVRIFVWVHGNEKIVFKDLSPSTIKGLGPNLRRIRFPKKDISRCFPIDVRQRIFRKYYSHTEDRELFWFHPV